MSRLKRKPKKRFYCPPRRATFLPDLRQCPVIEITWHDATSLAGWHGHDEVTKLLLPECRTVGYLLLNTSVSIKVAQNINDDGGMGDIMTISPKWVTRVRLLRKGRHV